MNENLTGWMNWDVLRSPSFLGGLLLGGTVALFIASIWQWGRLAKARNEARKDALTSSRATLKGQISEQLAPWFPEFPYSAADARFIGAPIDLLVFDRLSEKDGDVDVILVELKTGNAKLSKNERRIKKAVSSGRVRFETIRLKAPGDD